MQVKHAPQTTCDSLISPDDLEEWDAWGAILDKYEQDHYVRKPNSQSVFYLLSLSDQKPHIQHFFPFSSHTLEQTYT